MSGARALARSSIRSTALLCAFVLAGCAGGLPGPGGSVGGGGEAIVDFDGALRAGDDFPSVSGSVRAVASPGATAVFVNLRGAQPGSYAWRVQRGRCGSNGAPVAPQARLPALVVGDDGSGRITTSIPVQLSPAESYHVVVQASGGSPDAVLACGELSS